MVSAKTTFSSLLIFYRKHGRVWAVFFFIPMKKWKKFVLPFAIFLVQNESTAQTRARPTLEFCSRLCFVHYFDSWPKLIIPLITRVEGEGGLSPTPPITTIVSLVPAPIIGCTWQDTTYNNISILINVSTHPLYNHNQRHTNKHSFKLWAMQSTAHTAPSPTHIKTRHHIAAADAPTYTFSFGPLPATSRPLPRLYLRSHLPRRRSSHWVQAGEWKLTIIIIIYIIFMFPIIPPACLVPCTDDVGIAI